MSPIKVKNNIEILKRTNDDGIVVIDSRKEEKVILIDFDLLSTIKAFLGIQ